jgi:hypothetical protein
VASSCNPWDVLKLGDHLYVTGLFTNKVYKISLADYSVVGSLEVGTAPEGLAAIGQRLFVGVTGGYQNGYANSAVAVVDLDVFSLETSIPVWYNPQYLIPVDGYLHVSCTGNWVDQAGKIDIIDPDTLEHVHRIDLGGNPGSLWKGSDANVYVCEGMNTAVYSYDAAGWQVLHGPQNPLAPGAFAVDGSDSMIALLQANWGTNSTVQIMSPDWIPLQQFTAGLSATDLIVVPEPSADPGDEAQQRMFRLFPNPVHRNGILSIDHSMKGRARLEIFNLRGQKAADHVLTQGRNEIRLPGLAPGVYVFRISAEGMEDRGKLLLR